MAAPRHRVAAAALLAALSVLTTPANAQLAPPANSPPAKVYVPAASPSFSLRTTNAGFGHGRAAEKRSDKAAADAKRGSKPLP
jgi:hypothetical protein